MKCETKQKVMQVRERSDLEKHEMNILQPFIAQNIQGSEMEIFFLFFL
jgi:hypothetical protein